MTARAWLVDLDGTLYYPMPVKLAMAAELGLCGWPAIATLRAFRGHHEGVRGRELGALASPFALQVEMAAEELGRAADEVEHVVREWMVRRPGKWLTRFKRGALVAEIGAFRAQGGRTALVSDYPAREKLAAMGLSELFEVVVASGEADGPRTLKPEPEGYLAAARALGVEPEGCLVIGDRDDADGEAARRAGMGFRHIGG